MLSVLSVLSVLFRTTNLKKRKDEAGPLRQPVCQGRIAKDMYRAQEAGVRNTNK
jgi:hypothetical protein